MQHLDGDDALGCDGLTIGSVLSLIQHNLVLNRLLHHWLLHRLHHVAWLLHTSCRHVHLRGHIPCIRVRLVVHKHLSSLVSLVKLRIVVVAVHIVSSRILIVPLSLLIVLSRLITIDDRRLVQHLPMHGHWLDEVTVHGVWHLRVVRHLGHLILIHVGLLRLLVPTIDTTLLTLIDGVLVASHVIVSTSVTHVV